MSSVEHPITPCFESVCVTFLAIYSVASIQSTSQAIMDQLTFKKDESESNFTQSLQVLASLELFVFL